MIYFCPAKNCYTTSSSNPGSKPNIKFCATHGYHLQGQECKPCKSSIQDKDSMYCKFCGKLLSKVEA